MAAVNNNVVDPKKKNTNTGNPVNLPLTDTNQPSPTPLPGTGEPTPAPTPYSGAETSSAGAVNPSHNATIYDNPNAKFTDAEWEAILGMYNISDPEYYNDLYTFGGLTQDINESIAHGGTTTPEYYNGTNDWYRYDRADRPDYSNDADATFLNGVGYHITTQNKNEWHRLEKLKKEAMERGDTAEVAQLQAKQDNLHIINEKIRAGAGYSGGVDGSMYYIFADENSGNDFDGSHGKKGQSSGGSDPNSELKGLLDAWQQAALKQSDGRIDYAVQKAVTDLERALADAQPMFKEQAETVAREERQALDNSALYAEMRGDKGGIGQEQYNSIQNTAAQNHLTVQQAQTKLATDTQRQIADLRAQGEFEKADAALQITQQYLQQLIGLEQWAAEYNLSVDQFNESVRQWEAEYNMAMQQLQISQNQWQAEFNASQNQWQQEFDFAQKQYQNSLDQWEREFAAEQMLAQMKLANSGGGGNPNKSMTLAEAKALADDGVFTEQSLAVFYENGYTDEHLKDLYRYKPTVEPQTGKYDSESVARLGLGSNVSDAYIDQLLNDGMLQFYVVDGKIYVYWADNYGFGGIPTAPLPSFLQLGNLSTGGNSFVSGSTGGGYSGGGAGGNNFVRGSTGGGYSGGGASGNPTLYGVKN